jgi:hypothetical protein
MTSSARPSKVGELACGFQIDDQSELGRKLDRQGAGLLGKASGLRLHAV